MSKLIREIKTYEYNTEEEMNKEIMIMSKSEWLFRISYNFFDKWRAEYQKNY